LGSDSLLNTSITPPFVSNQKEQKQIEVKTKIYTLQLKKLIYWRESQKNTKIMSETRIN